MSAPAEPKTRRRRRTASRRAGAFERALAQYRDLTLRALLADVPAGGPAHLYDLVSVYPSRMGKGLRGALCLATCEALGGRREQALDTAVAAELFHNAFLIHDDVQDESLARRGGATLHTEYGIAIAVNVGNATNLLGLQRVIATRSRLGAARTALVVEETERMMRHSLEGQAIELGWIRDNVCVLEPQDYLRMCLKKTGWYSFIYPMRAGAIIAEGAQDADRFSRFGWYVGAAFQIQDDILNLTGQFSRYRKEIGGDLREGKRTLMLIRLLGVCTPDERRSIEQYLASPRPERTDRDVRWLYRLMVRYDTIRYARRAARELAGAAFFEALTSLRKVPDSAARRFLLDMPVYVIGRDH